MNEYVSYYHERRFHQGLDGKLIEQPPATNDEQGDGAIRCHSRLGGMLNYYYREAA
jgi:hypothetical protein